LCEALVICCAALVVATGRRIADHVLRNLKPEF
jgi:hypothetical protein